MLFNFFLQMISISTGLNAFPGVWIIFCGTHMYVYPDLFLFLRRG